MKVDNDRKEQNPLPDRSRLDMRVRRIQLKGSKAKEKVYSES